MEKGTQTGTADPRELPSIAELAARLPGYRLEALVGRGGMGAVYRAHHEKLDRRVAIKVLLPDLESDPEFAERFEREARALAKLSHSGIVQIHDFGVRDGLCFLVMEHVDGASLRELLADGRMTARDALAFIPQICDALQYAHDAGVVHRDIKPENILIDQEGSVKLADFGLAKVLGQDDVLRLTRSHQVMGTPHYMAPEQVGHASAVDHRADIFSLGVVLYEMLTGELPIGRFALPSAKAAGAKGLDAVILKSLEAEPERRYQQAYELKQELTTPPATAAAPSAYPQGRAKSPARDAQPVIPWATWGVFGLVFVSTWLSWAVIPVRHILPGTEVVLGEQVVEHTAWSSWVEIAGTRIPNWFSVVLAGIVATLQTLRFYGVRITRTPIVLPALLGLAHAGFVTGVMIWLKTPALGSFITSSCFLCWVLAEAGRRSKS